MTAHRVTSTLFQAVSAMLFSTSVVLAQGAPCSQCGPGAHWIDSCAAGTDQVADNGAVVGIDTNTDGNLDCLVDVNLVLSPCAVLTVSRSGPLDDSAQFPGTRPVDGHLDVIDTELLSMCLTGSGVTLKAGFGTGNGGVLGHSYGAIAEQAADPTLGDSFFDVFFEVDLGGGNFAYNQTAMRIQAAINCVPPRVIYIHPTGCLPLFTSPVGGTQIANLVWAQHNVNMKVFDPMKKNFRIHNRSGATAKDLHLTFAGTGGNLAVSVLSSPVGCGNPSSVVVNQPAGTADITWSSECFRAEDVVIIRANTTNGPLSVAGGEWTYQLNPPVALNPATDVIETNVPTVTQWGMVIMTLLLLTAATIIFARRKQRPAYAGRR